MIQHTFDPPGPGVWHLDDSHMPDPVSRYARDFFFERIARALSAAMPFYGLLLERFDVRFVAGRPYMRPKPVGAPELRPGKAPGRPPKLIFKLLLLLHPELRRRIKRAKQVMEQKLWRQVRDDFRASIAPRFRAENLRLQAIDPAALDDGALLEHIDELERLLDEGIRVHFHNNPAHQLPVGDWLRHALRWTGESPAACLEILRGSSPASSETAAQLDRIAAAVEAEPSALAALRATGDPADRLERLRAASGEATRALDEYLQVHGNRMATGYDFTELTLHEMPGLLLSTIAARIEGRTGAYAEGAASQAAALRQRVPEEHRAEYDELLDEARSMFGLRDEGVGLLFGWPQGILRRALLAAGHRLAGRDAIREPVLVFEASPAELRALLTGEAGAPEAAELARREEERVALTKLDPPLTLGAGGSPPPEDWLPPHCARMMGAVMLFHQLVELDEAERVASTTVVLGGHGASSGCYEGIARVVRGPEDFHRIAPGDVLVARVTAPGYNVVLPLLGAVVTDRGGALCHAAIVAREFGIPSVVGTVDATQRIRDGGRVRVDGDAGTVEILS